MRKSELMEEVQRFNDKYCKKTKNELFVHGAYGGYEICLRAKTAKNGKRLKSGLGDGIKSITCGYDTAFNTLNDLYRAESRGYLKDTIRNYEKR